MSFNILCDDILCVIIYELDIETLLLLRATCKRLNNLIMKHFKSGARILQIVNYHKVGQLINKYNYFSNNIYIKLHCECNYSFKHVINLVNNGYLEVNEINFHIQYIRPNILNIPIYTNNNVTINKLIFYVNDNVNEQIENFNIKPKIGNFLLFDSFKIPYSKVLEKITYNEIHTYEYLILENLSALCITSQDINGGTFNINVLLHLNKLKYLSLFNFHLIHGSNTVIEHFNVDTSLYDTYSTIVDFNKIILTCVEKITITNAIVLNLNNVSKTLKTLELVTLKGIVNYSQISDLDILRIWNNNNEIDMLQNISNLTCKINKLELLLSYKVLLDNMFHNCFKVYINSVERITITNSLTNCFEFVVVSNYKPILDDYSRKAVMRLYI